MAFLSPIHIYKGVSLLLLPMGTYIQWRLMWLENITKNMANWWLIYIVLIFEVFILILLLPWAFTVERDKETEPVSKSVMVVVPLVLCSIIRIAFDIVIIVSIFCMPFLLGMGWFNCSVCESKRDERENGSCGVAEI